jgi:hypothetical protein
LSPRIARGIFATLTYYSGVLMRHANEILRQRLLQASLIACFLAPYLFIHSFWWKFLPATFLILLCQWRQQPRSWMSDLGLRMNIRELFQSIVLFGVAAWASWRYLFWLAADLGLESGSSLVPPAWRFLPVGQVLNEEMVLRALLLGWVTRRVSQRWWLSPLCAAIFVGAHDVLYAFLLNGDLLAPTTMAALFFFGLATNDLFLKYGHIGYSVALHLGWNLTRFGEQWMYQNRWLEEFLGFNLIEGDHRTVLASACLWLLVRLVMALPARGTSQGDQDSARTHAKQN